MPKATRYNNVKYRSRLEARWAVFFKTLGVAFEYEPMTFDTSLGWYLPDFYLPKTDWFVEIKPTEPTVEEVIKARDVSYQGYKIGILAGPPNAKIQAVFFIGGKEVFFSPGYYQRVSSYWQSRPGYILRSAIWLRKVTGKKNFNKGFKIANEYKFKER